MGDGAEYRRPGAQLPASARCLSGQRIGRACGREPPSGANSQKVRSQSPNTAAEDLVLRRDARGGTTDGEHVNTNPAASSWVNFLLKENAAAEELGVP